MKKENRLFKVLTFVFGLGMVMIGIVIVAVLFFAASVMGGGNLEGVRIVPDSQRMLFYDGKALTVLFGSPAFVGSTLVFSAIYLYMLYLVRGLFKNLANERIFIQENVHSAKKVAILLVVVAFIEIFPLFLLHQSGMMAGAIPFDWNSILMALVVWALAKILEKANQIAAENELTI